MQISHTHDHGFVHRAIRNVLLHQLKRKGNQRRNGKRLGIQKQAQYNCKILEQSLLVLELLNLFRICLMYVFLKLLSHHVNKKLRVIILQSNEVSRILILSHTQIRYSVQVQCSSKRSASVAVEGHNSNEKAYHDNRLRV